MPSANDKMVAAKKRAVEKKQRLDKAQAQLVATTASQVAPALTALERVMEEEGDEGGGVGSSEEGQHSTSVDHRSPISNASSSPTCVLIVAQSTTVSMWARADGRRNLNKVTGV